MADTADRRDRALDQLFLLPLDEPPRRTSTSLTRSRSSTSSPALNRERGRAVAMTLHDLNHAALYCDHMLVILGGAIVTQVLRRRLRRGSENQRAA